MADDGGLELSREEREMQKKLKAVRARRENARQVSQDLKATLNSNSKEYGSKNAYISSRTVFVFCAK